MPACWPFFARSRFVDRQRPALEVLLVEHSDRLGRIFLRGHLNEREPTGSSSGTVLHDVNRDYPARLPEVVLQIIFGRGEG